MNAAVLARFNEALQQSSVLEENQSAMVSPDVPSPIKKVNPSSPIKKAESFGSSPVNSMAEKLRMVR